MNARTVNFFLQENDYLILQLELKNRSKNLSCTRMKCKAFKIFYMYTEMSVTEITYVHLSEKPKLYFHWKKPNYDDKKNVSYRCNHKEKARVVTDEC